MTIRQGLLALLGEQPMYGYQLRQLFETRTGGTWPLNIGQVYTTLSRLQRDGLIEEHGRQDDATLYRVTDAGRRTIDAWWLTPVDRTVPARDEMAIKLALAVTTPGVDVRAVVQRQRLECIRGLLEYTRLKAQIDDSAEPNDIAWLLVLDSLMFGVEGEIRWLDHVEQRLAKLPPAGDPHPGVPQPAQS